MAALFYDSDCLTQNCTKKVTKNNRAAIRIPHGVPKVPEIV